MQIYIEKLFLDNNSSNVASNKTVSKFTIDNLKALIDTCSSLNLRQSHELKLEFLVLPNAIFEFKSVIMG